VASEMQTLIIWALLVKTNGASYQSELKPEVKKADRTALVEAGLLRCEKHGARFWLEVTDKGWAWANDHLHSKLPPRSTAGCGILQAWLAHLQEFMHRKNMSLAEILGPQTVSVDIRDRIRSAYFKLTGGVYNKPILLSNLRGELNDVDRRALDTILTQMHLEEGTTLSGLDNPREMTPSIREAGVDFKGQQMYVLWITK
jgi:hypothetical protein